MGLPKRKCQMLPSNRPKPRGKRNNVKKSCVSNCNPHRTFVYRPHYRPQSAFDCRKANRHALSLNASI
jgi:hypothetical protein